MKMNVEHTPLVSVIMAAYNAEEYIAEAIGSVLAQTVTDWELIVVDDCSEDSTLKIVERFAAAEPRIRPIRNEQNAGAAHTRNRAMELARGAYVAFLDSDDIWYPEKLEKQLSVMESRQAELCYTSYRLVATQNRKTICDYIVGEHTDFEDMLCQNRIGCSTVLMTRELADRYRFTTEFYHEDYVLWLKMLRQGVRFIGLSELLVDYRYYPTSKAGNKFVSARYRWDIYRRGFAFSRLKSAGYLTRYILAGMKKYLGSGS